MPLRGCRAVTASVGDSPAEGYFDSTPHAELLALASAQIADRTGKGTPLGGVISALLANLYPHWFDALFNGANGSARTGEAKLVRYADDMVVLARRWTPELTECIESRLERKFQLEINRDKSRVADLKAEGESLMTDGHQCFKPIPVLIGD